MAAQLGDYSKAVFLINDKVRGIACAYDPDEEKRGKTTVFKSMDHTIKKGDYVVVPTDTRFEMTVVKVMDVDVDVDLTSPAKLAWIIGSVERTDFENILALEADAIDRIKSAEKRQMKDDLRKSLLGDHAEVLKEVSLATVVTPLPPSDPNNS